MKSPNGVKDALYQTYIFISSFTYPKQFQTIVPIASDSTADDESARSDLEMNLMPSFSACLHQYVQMAIRKSHGISRTIPAGYFFTSVELFSLFFSIAQWNKKKTFLSCGALLNCMGLRFERVLMIMPITMKCAWNFRLDEGGRGGSEGTNLRKKLEQNKLCGTKWFNGKISAAKLSVVI